MFATCESKTPRYSRSLSFLYVYEQLATNKWSLWTQVGRSVPLLLYAWTRLLWYLPYASASFSFFVPNLYVKSKPRDLIWIICVCIAESSSVHALGRDHAMQIAQRWQRELAINANDCTVRLNVEKRLRLLSTPRCDKSAATGSTAARLMAFHGHAARCGDTYLLWNREKRLHT